jgi:hypothetical protein
VDSRQREIKKIARRMEKRPTNMKIKSVGRFSVGNTNLLEFFSASGQK